MPRTGTIDRAFLGWQSSPLIAAVAQLQLTYRQGQELNLGRVIAVLPGRRAGKRLLELLVEASDSARLVLKPPRIITENELPELLYEQRKPLATPLVRALVWAETARTLDERHRATLIPNPPPGDARLAWFRIGEMLQQVHSDIAADGHTIDSVLEAAAGIPGFSDRARWEAFRAALQSYHDRVRGAGLWDPDSARLAAIERGEVSCESDIVLIGMIDFNAVISRMLNLVAGRVTALIAAPADESERFDAFGRLIPEAWQAYSVPIRDEQVSYAEDPAGQAAATARWLANLNGRYSADQIVIGVPDPSVVPLVRRRLDNSGTTLRWLEERNVGDSGPYRLLAAAILHATNQSFESFAGLARHPDLALWLEGQGLSIDLAALDEYYADRLPATLGRIPAERYGNLPAVVQRIRDWLKPARGEKPLSEWAVKFADLLKPIYGVRGELLLDREPDRTIHASLQKILAALSAIGELPGQLAPTIPAGDAFAIALEAVSRDALPPPHDSGTIELLGWLELPWDTASAVLVTSFNDGFVPTAAGADPFLPDTLRTRLGIENNARRYARDAYLTTLLAQSRHFGCIAARRDADKNPLLPSRLLFTGPDSEVVGRASRWSRSHEPMPIAPAIAKKPSPFSVPEPAPQFRKSGSFHVTEFKTYLACKYRYYLKHIRKLASAADNEREFNGGTFGTLIHRILEEWGGDPEWRECRDAKALAENLIGRLTAHAESRFAGSRPAVRLQIAQAARRFRGFAECQVQLLAEGWQTIYAEQDRQSLTAPFALDDGSAVDLLGRIDRIDYHAESNTVRILDYKTSDTAKSPESAHRKKQGDWIDLQLPLYRHLWRLAPGADRAPADANVELGYFQIPRDWQNVCVAVPQGWDRGVLDAADAAARTAIAGIQAGVFWPRTDPAPKYFEEFAAICLDGLNAPTIADEDAEVDA